MSEHNQKKADKSTIQGQGAKSGSGGTGQGHNLDLTTLGRSIIESLSIGVVAFDLELKIIETNSAAAEIVEIEDYIDRSLAKGTDEKVWNNWTFLLKSAMTTEKKSVFEEVRYDFNNQKKLLHIICTPLKDSRTQKVIGGAVVIEDVTERMDIEQQLAQTERFAAVGKVAGKVAHELNNPMDGILRYINLAIRIIDKGDLKKARQYLEQCREGLMRMVHIIGELLEFSRSTYSSFEYAPVDEVVAEAVRAMKGTAQKVEMEVIHQCHRKIPKVRSDSLFQVFCNLIKNAVDAMQGNGLLKITISCPEDMLEIEFYDTGHGFAPEMAETMFEPFFTTKEYGRGTGLGLAICRDIVEKYNGRIIAENAPQGGGVFTVCLPLKEKPRE
jgi:PAS domain S-box-containing protein